MKGTDSNFRVLEPMRDKINDTQSRLQAPGFGKKLGFGSVKSEWFKVYKVSHHRSCRWFEADIGGFLFL
jgi:hypothetical protein